jgi:hypothetical protein
LEIKDVNFDGMAHNPVFSSGPEDMSEKGEIFLLLGSLENDFGASSGSRSIVIGDYKDLSGIIQQTVEFA